MSSIQERAKIELDRINFGEEDTQAMLRILRIFFGTWDSGGAVSVAAPVLTRLLDGKPLSPLTGEADEWIDRSEMSHGPLLQNVRMWTVFKEDGRCYDIDDPERRTITFPYSGYEPSQRYISAPWNVERLMERGLDRESAEFICGEQWTAAQLEKLMTLAGLRGVPIMMPELTPEQQKAFEEEWTKPGNITWLDGRTPLRPMGSGIREHDILGSLAGGEIIDGDATEPGHAIGEPEEIGTEQAMSLYLRICDDAATLMNRAIALEAQLQAEGAHTEAANAEIERLKAELAEWKMPD